MSIITALDRWRPTAAVIGSLALSAVIGTLDLVTGYELSLSGFYLIPIALAAWVGGVWWGLVIALVDTLVGTVADIMAGHVYSNPMFIYWNAFMRLALFFAMAYLLSKVKELIRQEQRLAREDHLTGAANSRAFMEMVSSEVDRAHRYGRPFTLAYIDLDNFKGVNDSLGHGTGDQVLQAVVAVIRPCIRSTDVVARLGGDEFAILLPETDQEQARIALAKIRSSLLTKMEERRWPVTASIGSLTCRDARLGVDAIIKCADNLMYEVKAAGKNGIRFAIESDQA